MDGRGRRAFTVLSLCLQAEFGARYLPEAHSCFLSSLMKLSDELAWKKVSYLAVYLFRSPSLLSELLLRDRFYPDLALLVEATRVSAIRFGVGSCFRSMPEQCRAHLLTLSELLDTHYCFPQEIAMQMHQSPRNYAHFIHLYEKLFHSTSDLRCLLVLLGRLEYHRCIHGSALPPPFRTDAPGNPLQPYILDLLPLLNDVHTSLNDFHLLTSRRSGSRPAFLDQTQYQLEASLGDLEDFELSKISAVFLTLRVCQHGLDEGKPCLKDTNSFKCSR
jgi:hypothetical protein